MGVLPDLSAGCGDVLGCRGEARAVVGAVQVIVDGLGYAHDAALIAHLLHILGDLVAGVHGVVAAVVEEVADVVLFEDLQNTPVIGVVHIGVGQLIAAGAQGRGGSELQQIQFPGVLLSHIVQLVLQHALDSVGGPQNVGDAVSLQSGLNHALSTGVNNCGRTSGLANDAGAGQLLHVCFLLKCQIWIQNQLSPKF